MTGHMLVTGGAGFIGRLLCQRLLQAGHRVTVLDDLSTGDAKALPAVVNLVTADICDRVALRSALKGVDGVFHLAAVSSVEACLAEPAASSRTNLQGTVTLIEEATGLPLVYASSAAVYGDQKDLPITESATPDPISPYAVDKLASERHLALAASLHDERMVALRLFNVYGPGQPADSPYAGVIARFAARALAGLPLTIQGDGSQTRDFVHVTDVVAALVAGMARAQSGPTGQFTCANVCSGRPISVLDLAQSLSTLADQRAPIVFAGPRPGDIRHSIGDPAHAREVLGIRSVQGFEHGLRDVLSHLETQPVALGVG